MKKNPTHLRRPSAPSSPAMSASHDPPFLRRYGSLFSAASEEEAPRRGKGGVLEECELPVIDLRVLREEAGSRTACSAETASASAEMASASSEWGFFQVVNHGVSGELLEEIREEQKRLFRVPFEKKERWTALNESYRWGNPTATSLDQLSWSEAFHVPLSNLGAHDDAEEFTSLREAMRKVASAMLELARILSAVLAENLGCRRHLFGENCSESTCFLRLNRYPPCPFSPNTMGLVPHTDSDFMTILHQDHVGGLQLMKDSKWVSIKPNPEALIVNIGDLFQAWSNDVYKSVQHRVMTNRKAERYSIAFFLCPSYDSVIGSCKEPSPYKRFTFKEFRAQVQEDVKATGYKVGLSRFLL
ncbi:Gibberellin 2-beta-dioxygenase 8 [Platanthera guangdongensis]|uniref:Gibberellin 2-beta-dioxygenase 8 n=1 Tax=Platanthera guangdongensis TaxID=2320717 RepID=A0ABR2MAC3_9ASPA